MMLYGADVEQLRGLSGVFNSGAEVLESLPKAIDALLSTCQWVGPNADRFREWWSSLPPERQEALLKAWPADIYRLKGIPADVRKKLEGDGPYNRMEMLDYAIKNWDDESSDLFSKNCANYVSHAMEAGGMRHTESWGYDGDTPWYEEGRDWLGIDKLARDTNVTMGWSNANAQRDMWVEFGHKPIPQERALPGDLLYMTRRDGHAYHAMIVRAVAPDGTLYLAGHTSNTRTHAIPTKGYEGTFEIYRPNVAPEHVPKPSPGPSPTLPS